MGRGEAIHRNLALGACRPAYSSSWNHIAIMSIPLMSEISKLTLRGLVNKVGTSLQISRFEIS